MIVSVDTPARVEAPELIPARMLNEFCYCPRLGYLMWVEGEFADNLDTIEGRFGHRRVDRPSHRAIAKPKKSAKGAKVARAETGPISGVNPWVASLEKVERDKQARSEQTDEAAVDPSVSPLGKGRSEGEVASDDGALMLFDPDPDEDADSEFDDEEVERLHSRSLQLSAPIEGLVAKMDLVEIDGPVATPVDYKRGKAPDLPEGAWEPERVQLCAQGLVLREAGFQSDAGVLYFIASKRRVRVPFDEALVARTRELIRQLRETASNGIMPRPLVDSPKCPRCSLVGICLPDETNLLTGIEAPTPAPGEAENPQRPDGTRRLVPTRDDAVPLYVQEQGAMVSKAGERIEVRKSGERIASARLIDVSQVCVFGNVQVSASAIRDFADRGVPICHLSYGGWFCAMTTGMAHKNVELRIKQFEIARSSAAARFARGFVAGKIKNCRTMLRRNLEADPGRLVDQLGDLVRRAEACSSIESLLGIEGTAARLYFDGFGRLLKGSPQMLFEDRNRRPPRDPVNALLSFLYSILVKELAVVLQGVGFDPMLGFYHQPRYGRPSLVLDLMEEFRPLIVDSVVLGLINTGEVNDRDFLSRAGGVTLTTNGRKTVLAAFERRMDSLVTHPLFGYRVSYRRLLEVQARLLARAIKGELDSYPHFVTR